MAPKNDQEKLSRGKYWFCLTRIAGRITSYFKRRNRMNEEMKTASEIVRDPASVSAYVYSIIIGMATLGGIVRVIREAKFSDKSWKQIVGMFLAEIVVSQFVGFLTFFLCAAREVSLPYTIVFVILASHMGGRALNVLELVYKRWLGKGD